MCVVVCGDMSLLVIFPLLSKTQSMSAMRPSAGPPEELCPSTDLPGPIPQKPTIDIETNRKDSSSVDTKGQGFPNAKASWVHPLLISSKNGTTTSFCGYVVCMCGPACGFILLASYPLSRLPQLHTPSCSGPSYVQLRPRQPRVSAAPGAAKPHRYGVSPSLGVSQDLPSEVEEFQRENTIGVDGEHFWKKFLIVLLSRLGREQLCMSPQVAT